MRLKTRLFTIIGLILVAKAPQIHASESVKFDLAAYERPRLIQEAESVISLEPKTIVAAANPRSAGGIHDWSSEGDYWWPNPKNPNGPYIQRDGMTNPDNFIAHRQFMLAFVRAFDALAAAYKVTADERYAEAAVKHLRAWFINPATKMAPNLNYAQAIHNKVAGRGTGVIDTVHFAEVALGIEVLRHSKALTAEDDKAVTQWFKDYLVWLQTSPNGTEEEQTLNNHGTCWVLQAASFAHLVNDQVVLAKCRTRFKQDLLPNQMAANGSFPRELARTKPYGYSIFNLDVMTSLAMVLSTPSENLMTYTLSDGRSMLKGVAFLAPYVADKTKWPKKPDVMYWNDWPVREPFLIFGALNTDNATWLDKWKKLDPDPTVEEIRRNLPVRQPILWVN